MAVRHLIGRDMVLDVVSGAISNAANEGTALLLTGERGIGKTACVLAAQTIARETGCRLIETVGVEAESKFEFASLHRLLRPIMDIALELPAAQRSALLTAVGMKNGPAPDLLVVSLAALGLVREASREEQLLIAVDDINLLDASSLEVLSFVARRLGRGQVVIATSSAYQCLPQWTETFREVMLNRLEPKESEELLVRYAPNLAKDRLDWVRAHSLGNPLALIELAKVADSLSALPADPFDTLVPLTSALQRAFGHQLQSLPQLSLDALLIAALDEECSIQEILAATSLLVGECVSPEVLDAPRSLGLLKYDETRVIFSHPLVRSAVAMREPVGRHKAAHTALGETIVMNFGRRIWHRAIGTSGRDDLIATELERHGADCIRRHNDSDGAVAAWIRAAQLSTAAAERGRRLLLAARRAADMGRFDFADALLRSACEGELSHLDMFRAALLRDAWSEHSHDSDRVLRLCNEAKRSFTAGQDGLALELIYSASLTRSGEVISVPALSAVTQLAESLPRDSMDPKILAILSNIDPVRHGRYVMDAIARINDSLVGAEGFVSLCFAARGVGDYTRGLEFLKEARVLLGIGKLHGQLAGLRVVEVDMRLELGDWSGAMAAMAEVNSLDESARRAIRQGDALAAAAKVAALRGEVSTALELVVEIEHCSTVRRGSPALAVAQIARGIAYMASSRHLDAYHALSRIFDLKSPSHHHREQFGAVMYLADAAVRCGQHEGARSIVTTLESIADISGSILLVSQLQYARAILASDDHAEEYYVGCLSSDLAASPWARARVQLAYGRWLRRQQRVSQARGPLRAAQSTFSELGAVRWAAEALDELEAAGRPGEELRAASSATSLSVQELKIARLASIGLSNNEIGQQLSLSPRTVSSHLYRIFPKLGISARAQLASVLAQPTS